MLTKLISQHTHILNHCFTPKNNIVLYVNYASIKKIVDNPDQKLDERK